MNNFVPNKKLFITRIVFVFLMKATPHVDMLSKEVPPDRMARTGNSIVYASDMYVYTRFYQMQKDVNKNFPLF